MERLGKCGGYVMPELADYLGFKQQKLGELREKLAEPGTVPIPIAATCKVAGGSGVRPVQVREFSVVTDSSSVLAGYNLGPTAPELLLTAMASCLAHTFLIVAANRGLSYDALEVEVRGTIDFRGVLEVTPEAPIPPRELQYEARIKTNAGVEELTAVQQEVERLCPVLRAVTEPIPVQGRILLAGD